MFDLGCMAIFDLVSNCHVLLSAGLEDPDVSLVCSSGGAAASIGLAAVPGPPSSSQRLFCLPP